jgi:chromosome segregation ATPase
VSVEKLEKEKAAFLASFMEQYKGLKWASPKSVEKPKDLQAKLDSLCPSTYPEVQAALQTLRQELQSMPVYSEHQKREALAAEQKKDEARQDLEAKEKAYKAKMEEASKKESTLVLRIDRLVARINEHFSEMMQSMGNAGSVQLEGAGSCDFKNYGLAILVKFANSKGAMQKLAAGVQVKQTEFHWMIEIFLIFSFSPGERSPLSLRCT